MLPNGIRAVDLTVVNGKWLCDDTNQGMATRQRALDRGHLPRLTPTGHPSHAIRACGTNKRRCFQYAVRMTPFGMSHRRVLRLCGAVLSVPPPFRPLEQLRMFLKGRDADVE